MAVALEQEDIQSEAVSDVAGRAMWMLALVPVGPVVAELTRSRDQMVGRGCVVAIVMEGCRWRFEVFAALGIEVVELDCSLESWDVGLLLGRCMDHKVAVAVDAVVVEGFQYGSVEVVGRSLWLQDCHMMKKQVPVALNQDDLLLVVEMHLDGDQRTCLLVFALHWAVEVPNTNHHGWHCLA
jgi:hypothetical protein